LLRRTQPDVPDEERCNSYWCFFAVLISSQEQTTIEGKQYQRMAGANGIDRTVFCIGESVKKVRL
jgi:hypothetical protein